MPTSDSGGEPAARRAPASQSSGRLYLPVVTGMGAVTPFGWGVAPLVDGLMRDRRAFTEPSVFSVAEHRTSLAGEVPPEGAPPAPFASLGSAQRAKLARTDRFAWAATCEALEQAGWGFADLRALGPRLGLFFGSSTGGMHEGEEFYAALCDAPGERHSITKLATQQNQGPGETVARLLGTSGPNVTIATACAASTMALEAAWLALRSGEVDVALVGGSDGLCQLTYAGFNSLRAVSESPCEPFRAERDGLTLGEGAGVLVLERPFAAKQRGAQPLAQVLAAASTCDAHHMTAPEPEGEGIRRAILRALELADVSPGDVAFVNAHGTGTPHNDAAEAHAFGHVFAALGAQVPITSTKGAIGHLLGSAGVVEAIATIRCLQEGRVHPTPGTGEADPALGVDLVRQAVRLLPGAGVALSTNLAFGGANAAALFARVPGETRASSPSEATA